MSGEGARTRTTTTWRPGALEASRRAWAEQLLQWGRAHTAITLLDADAADPDRPWPRAGALVLTGRFAEARSALERARVSLGPPGQADLPAACLAAARAAEGDDDAWCWLREAVEAGGSPDVVRLAAVAAEARGEQEAEALRAGLVAWELLDEPERNSAGVAEFIERRPRLGTEDEVLAHLNHAMSVLTRWEDGWADRTGRRPADDTPTVTAVRAVMDALVQRDDEIGRDLLRAVAGAWLPEGRLGPPPTRSRQRNLGEVRSALVATGVVAVAVTAVAGLTALAVVFDLSPDTFGLWSVVLGLVAVAGYVVVRRRSALTPPGPSQHRMTSGERGVLRAARRRRIDPSRENIALDRDLGGADGWGLLLGVLAGSALAAVIALTLLDAGRADADGLLLAVTGGGAVLGGIAGVRWSRAFAWRRVSRRAAVAELVGERRLGRLVGRCWCWLPGPMSGEFARRNVANHLEPVDVVVPIEGARVAVCPSTTLLWLVGAVGVGGGWAGLPGAIPARPVEGTGMYL